jgi:hypothetical protein
MDWIDVRLAPLETPAAPDVKYASGDTRLLQYRLSARMNVRTWSSFAELAVTAGAVFDADAPASGVPPCPSTGAALSTFWKVMIVPTVPKLPVHVNV